jgi:hypothetical protein
MKATEWQLGFICDHEPELEPQTEVFIEEIKQQKASIGFQIAYYREIYANLEQSDNATD